MCKIISCMRLIITAEQLETKMIFIGFYSVFFSEKGTDPVYSLGPNLNETF